MRIAVPVSSECLVFQAERVVYWLGIKGYTAEVITPSEFYKQITQRNFGFYFCICRGADLNLFKPSFLKRFDDVCAWFYTTNEQQKQRFITPSFLASHIGMCGGWVFFAQYQDFFGSIKAVSRSSWLPVCSDPATYNNSDSPKAHDVCLVGDNIPNTLYDALVGMGYKVSRANPNDTPDILQVMYTHAKVTVHLPSLGYGPFDVQPSVVDAMACGAAVVTAPSDSLPLLFDKPTYLRTYPSLEELPRFLNQLIQEGFSGKGSRERVVNDLNYSYRLDMAISALRENGMKIDG